MNKGYIQLYTGNGKGKTTAALGLASRAAGAGLKVLFAQFLKKGPYSELSSLERLDISVKQFGSGEFVMDVPQQRDHALAVTGLEEVAEVLAGGEYDVVVLDEINNVLDKGLIQLEDLIAALKGRAEHTEVILTGRNAPEKLIALADLATEMREVKHYFTRGVTARDGIEQ